ncbi:glycosyltransferase involved in cell wall biosynthesis [Novosphingobium chloroacetimidivorans]|uniref:Glycosyltransferase involved in cell wall biosynthesis n=1 Tax=Novosphingobium chloroacetimidivorans TaxID=1428314 RepID=A0A7W7NVR0_9SPHN|nr:glycosyltransferase family 1 protein [Novosphingobium chloroacetimidivorans]MBB4857392.1 glycosyltransferase involved in cell wall biosynthesis [Novosphingobium chloroacetimidivorans]
MTATPPKDIVINGRFLTQKLSGVQRYSREIVQAADRLIHSEHTRFGGRQWRLLVPSGADPQFRLQAIRIEQVGAGDGHLWEQRDLAVASRGARLVNLGNSGPLLHRDRLVVIHDAAVFRTPGNFGRRYRLMHKALGRALAATGRIGTVSQFSRDELSQVLHLDPDRIVVINNGCDHFIGRDRDERVLDALGVEPQRYFLFVGNHAPNKNLRFLLEAFSHIGRAGAKLVVAGSLDRGVFGDGRAIGGEDVVLAPGLSDAKIAALYSHATAHVFPSVYEGFGIPPLEAMASGCPTIVSDIPVLREVCGDAASYFSLSDLDGLVSLLRQHWDFPQRGSAQRSAASERLERFTWERSARTLIEAVTSD